MAVLHWLGTPEHRNQDHEGREVFGGPGADGGPIRPAVILLAAAFLPFLLTAGFGLVWDDTALVSRTAASLREGRAGELLLTPFALDEKASWYYRPVMLASVLLDVIVSGGRPWFSHLVNILLHAVNSILVLSLFGRILGGGGAALAASLLFAVHPVHAEAVSFVAARTDLMALTFVLLALLPWTPSTAAKEGRPLVLQSCLAGISLFLGCLSKETAFMLPFVLLGWEGLRWKRPSWNRTVYFAILSAAAASAFGVRSWILAGKTAAGAVSIAMTGDFIRLPSAQQILQTLLVHMGMAVNPLPQRAYWFHGDLVFGAAMFFWAWVLTMIALAALWRRPLLSAMGLLWWAFFTLPALGFAPLVDLAVSERYAYIPSAGFCILVGVLVSTIPRPIPAKRFLVIAGTLTLVLLSLSAGRHARQWRDELTLFSQVVRTNPSYPDAWLNLGRVLAEGGRYGEALEAYGKAETLVPPRPDLANNRGNLLYRLGRHEEAVGAFDEALGLRPGNREAVFNRGMALAALGQDEMAASSFREAISLGAPPAKALLNLGILAAKKDRHEEALRLYSEALQHEPDQAKVFEAKGESLQALGRVSEAEQALMRAVELSAGDPSASVRLGFLMMETKRPEAAYEVFKTVLANHPASASAWVGYMVASDAVGKGPEAGVRLDRLNAENPELVRGVLKAVSEANSKRTEN